MIDQGLVIQKVWLDKILSGEKTWEMRSRPTKKRGLIGLIEKGSGKIVGIARIIENRPALTRINWSDYYEEHGVPQDIADSPSFNWFVPWVLTDVQKLVRPIHYRHPSGAVQFVNLSEDEQIAVSGAVARRPSQELTLDQQPRLPRAGLAGAAASSRRVAKRRYVGIGIIAIFGLVVSSISLFFYIMFCVLTWSGSFATFLWLGAAVFVSSAASELCLPSRSSVG